MTGALSTISGHLRRPLVVGTFTPVIIFVAVAIIVVGPLLPFGDVDVHSLLDVQTREFILLVAVVLSLTGAIYSLNVPIVRFFEGYPWSESWFGRWRSAVHRRRRAALSSRWKTILGVLDVMTLDRSAADNSHVFAFTRSLGRRINFAYPKSADVLPTSLGNVVRAFEEYPDNRYGIAGVTMWPRLTAVMDRDFAEAVDETKTSFDFMVNCSMLSGLLGLFLLLATLAFPGRLFVVDLAVPVVAVTAALLAVSQLTYMGAVNQAHTWGGMVRSAYDLYRLPLSKRLGYEGVPVDAAAEWKFWDAISRHMMYGDTGRVALPPYGHETAVSTPSGDVPIVLARMLERTADGRMDVVIVLRTTSRTPAVDVHVYEPLPPGWTLVTGSARADVGTVAVQGAGPYVFQLKTRLAVDKPISLRYRAMRSDGSRKE